MEQVLESVVVGFGNLGSLKRVMMLLLGHWDSLAMCHPNVLHSITRLAGKRTVYETFSEKPRYSSGVYLREGSPLGLGLRFMNKPN